MQPDAVVRRLAAILSADAVSYSRLMAEDEVATVQTLQAHREHLARLVFQHRGRVVDSPGDNLLAEFPSALDAVRSAVEIQRALEASNAGLPPDRRMEFRIGIHLGDVMVDGDRIYGDGINIAARIERLAEPRGRLRLRPRLGPGAAQAWVAGRGPRRPGAQEHPRTGPRLPGIG